MSPSDAPTLPTPGIRAVVAGATGLVGRECLKLLLAHDAVSSVTALLRRRLSVDQLLGTPGAAPAQATAGKLQPAVVDFEHLDRHAGVCTADWVFCALGTTIRQAGSQAAFRRVDFDYPLHLARLARAQGARHFLLVSALGANAGARVFYSRVKGELEDAVRALGFESLTIAQPSLLLGDRAEFRLGEALAQRLAFLTPGPYKPVHVRQVARALTASAHQGRPGVHLLHNATLRSFPADPIAP